jgi:catechol 2,3-dioxygenase-like lactoylglutathione lyase family enzyme
MNVTVRAVRPRAVTWALIFRLSGEEVVVSILRVVPDIVCDKIEESRDFYVRVLGFDAAMDMGWIVTLVSPDVPTAQLSLFPADDRSPAAPDVTVEVDDVDAVHGAVVRGGFEIAYPLTDEDWGVRRFFVVDPSGVVVNVMSHVGGSDG